MPLAIRSDVPFWRDPVRRQEAALLLFIGLLAFLIRLSGAFVREPTLGEMAASQALSLPFWTVFTGPLSEQCPPLFWALLWPVSTASGGALEIMRIWVALISALGCVLVCVAFRAPLKLPIAAMAAIFLAIHPAAVLAGRTVGPEALVPLALVLCLQYVFRTLDQDKAKNWLMLDLGLILLFTSHRGAMVAAVGVLFVHLALLGYRWFFPSKESLTLKPARILSQMGMHYGITALVSLPLAVVILRNPVFPVDAFDTFTLRDWIAASTLGGRAGERSLFGLILVGTGLFMMLPGLVAIFVERNWKALVAPVWLGAMVLIVLALAFAPGGFKIAGADLAGVTSVGIAMIVAYALAPAHRPVQITILATLGLGWTLLGVPQETPQLPLKALFRQVQQERRGAEPVLVWPDYLRTALNYHLGSKSGDGSLPGYLSSIDVADSRERVHVVLLRWPSNSSRSITLRGALQLHSEESKFWKAGNLGEVITVRGLDREKMNAWLSDPKTLDTDDKPVPRLTMHQWLPTNDIFSDEEQFHREPAEALFEPSGRRVVWTAKEEVAMNPQVNLAQGSYYLKVHCAPNEEGGPARDMDVILQAFERKLFRIQGETTLSLAFTTGSDLQLLPVRITATPLMEAGSGRFARKQGLKIYSMSVEPPAPLD